MEYQAKTVHISQKFEEIERSDSELNSVLNEFASRGYTLHRVVPDERLVSDRDAKKVFILIFIKDKESPTAL